MFFSEVRRLNKLEEPKPFAEVREIANWYRNNVFEKEPETFKFRKQCALEVGLAGTVKERSLQVVAAVWLARLAGWELCFANERHPEDRRVSTRLEW